MNEKKYTNGKTNKNDNDVSGQRNTNRMNEQSDNNGNKGTNHYK